MINIDNNISEDSKYYELIVEGEVDASSSIHLEEGLKTAMSEGKNIIVNLTGLEYISSAGLGVFMSIIQELENKEIKLVLYGMSEKVNEVFEILGLNQLITIKENKEDAIEAIN